MQSIHKLMGGYTYQDFRDVNDGLHFQNNVTVPGVLFF
jgi:hypothetical protein